MNQDQHNKFKIVDKILNDNSFYIKHSINSYIHYYYSGLSNYYIEYNTEDNELKVFTINNELEYILTEDKLNESDLSIILYKLV